MAPIVLEACAAPSTAARGATPHGGATARTTKTTRASDEQRVVGPVAAVVNATVCTPGPDDDADQGRRHHDRRRRVPVDRGVPPGVVRRAEDDRGAPVRPHHGAGRRRSPGRRARRPRGPATPAAPTPRWPSGCDAACPLKATVRSRCSSRSGESSRVVALRADVGPGRRRARRSCRRRGCSPGRGAPTGSSRPSTDLVGRHRRRHVGGRDDVADAEERVVARVGVVEVVLGIGHERRRPQRVADLVDVLALEVLEHRHGPHDEVVAPVRRLAGVDAALAGGRAT